MYASASVVRVSLLKFSAKYSAYDDTNRAGPGCSSLAFGAMQELGPFRVLSDGKTLYRNLFAWNNGTDAFQY